MQPTPEEQRAALDMIKAVHDDGEAEINGRKYAFHKMTHKKRRKVFAFFTAIGQEVSAGNMSFLDSPGYEAVEAVIFNAVSYEGSLLSKLGDQHWEEHPDDYVTFIQIALQVISYPFAAAAHTS